MSGIIAKPRSKWVDIAKGITIAALVLIHIDYNFPDSKLFPTSILLGGVWRTPVFFVIGGFFIKEEKLVDSVGFIKRKIKTLYLPLLYFVIPAVILHNTFIDIGWYDTVSEYGNKVMAYWSMGELIKNLILSVCLAGREPILGGMWFVYVLFMALSGLSIISYILRKIFKEDRRYELARLIVLFALCVMSCTASRLFDFTIPRFNNTLTAMWLIYCGYKLKNQLQLKFDNIYVLCLTSIILYHNATVVGGVGLNTNFYNDAITLTVASVAALYVVRFISRKIENSGVGSIFALCGHSSFYILALHFVGYKLCTYMLMLVGVDVSLSALKAPTGNSILYLILYFTCALLFPLFFRWLFRKIKIWIMHNILQLPS